MRAPPRLAALACGVGFAVLAQAPTASAESCNCGGRSYYAAGRSCVNVCPGNADHSRRWRRGGRRVRDHDAHRGYDRVRSPYAMELSNERAIRERGRVAAAAVQEQSWRLWRRPASVYGPPPTATGTAGSLRIEDLSPDLSGFFCLEGQVVYPKPATPEATRFCRESSP